jgi:hypothetical protein
MPATGRELSYPDFLRLVREADGRRAVAPLLREWFGCRVTGNGETTQIVDAKRLAVDMLSLHLRIQEDESKQRCLYQIAMTLWR